MATTDPAHDQEFVDKIGKLMLDKTKSLRPLLGHLVLQKVLPEGETAESFLRELRAHIARSAPKP
jgi:hypothetical protein